MIQATFLFISTGEIIFILFVAVMVFGTDKLPEVARGLGKGMRMIKDATNDIKHEIVKTAEKNGIDTNIIGDVKKSVDIDILGDAKKTITEVKDEVEDFSGSIKRKL